MKRKSAIILALVILIGVLFSGCGEGIGLGDETLVFEKGEASCKVKEFSNKSSITEFEPFQQYCQDEFPYPFSTPRFQNLECQGYETHSAYPIQFYPRGYKDRQKCKQDRFLGV